MGVGKHVLDLTMDLGRTPNAKTALHIMQWELGDLAKAVVYMDWHPDLSPGYQGEAKLALASLVFQARVVAALLGIRFTEVIATGEEIVMERIEEKRKKVGRFEHYNPPKGER